MIVIHLDFEFVVGYLLLRFQAARACTIEQQQDPEAVSCIHHVLRPFILRRTKVVLKNQLPKKTQYVRLQFEHNVLQTSERVSENTS